LFYVKVLFSVPFFILVMIFTDETIQNLPTNHKQVKVNYNVSTNHLPSTGETTSLLGLLGGVILLALSFVSHKRVK